MRKIQLGGAGDLVSLRREAELLWDKKHITNALTHDQLTTVIAMGCLPPIPQRVLDLSYGARQVAIDKIIMTAYLCMMRGGGR